MTIVDGLSAAWARWSRFWFEFDHPLGLAMTRLQLGAVLIYMYVVRQMASMSAFAADGMVPRELALPMMPAGVRPPFGWFFWPDSMNLFVHSVFVILCLMIFLGAWTRWVAWFAWILHMGFIQRNYSVLFGADVISSIFLFYLAFTRSDDRLSVRAWFRERTRSRREVSKVGARDGDAISSAFARLLQIQLAVIYAFTGFEKLKGASWWDGTALWTVLGNPQMVQYNVDWVRNVPPMIAAVTFLTIVFEIYWPAAISHKVLRPIWLVAGVLFHAGIGFLMALWTFSLIMLAPYWLFLDEARIQGLWGRLGLTRWRGFGVSK